ncbi:yippee-like protein [Vanrija pseudolonga]|uniref:Protein yippee-like n=1 Tax=Vanrija pseudolonga TaxID=143232 RepID=A0AAF0YA41_9TREE|nr:Protein yippee-like [Vanrija pseudolonga]
MGRSFRVYLAGEAVFLCRKCGNHLAVHENVESKSFHGQHGKAYLVQHVVNTYTSAKAEDREMRTGVHTVRDLYCQVCHTCVGWKYDYAYTLAEKYKEGKFILERELITERADTRRDFGKPRIDEVVVSRL